MMIHTASILVTLNMVLLTSATVYPDDYYKKFNKKGEANHTMTKYKGFGSRCNIGGKTTAVRSGPVTESEKAAFLKLHNDYRRQVAKGLETRGKAGPQPPATDMIELTWDDELAAFAQRWAEQCPGNGVPHDDNRRNDRWLWVGQNMFSDTDQSAPLIGPQDPPLVANIEKAMKFWTLEASFFDKANINPFQYTSLTGHYSQLVWGNVEKLGCGFFMSKELKHGQFLDTIWWRRFIVCDFGPGGNINGLVMYNEGSPASKCPSGTVANDGLCQQRAATTTTQTTTTTVTTTTAKPTTSPTNACSPKFQCGETCIPLIWLCDGIQDCDDNSDEKETMCKSPTRRCPQPKEEFLCKSGRCINKYWVCDGLYDCPDGDDETNCRPK